MRTDIVKIADLRFPGGTSAAIAHEIRALAAAGYSVALIQKDAQVLRQKRPINPLIQACIDQGWAALIDAETAPAVDAAMAVIHNPYVFADPGRDLPRITADVRVIVAHQPATDAQGMPYYDADAVQAHAEAAVGGRLMWAPISPVSRSNIEGALPRAKVLNENWGNVLFASDWAVARSEPQPGQPVIGRHSRPDWPKWPATRDAVLEVYPDSESIDVRLLGVGPDLLSVLGGSVPKNWQTFQFNALEPAEFLKSIDFFVYYHHPDWVEAFGRNIAEAAASGAVVILPDHFQPTFREAALYRAPSEVVDTVRELHACPESWRLQSELGRRTIDRLYGPAPYLNRVERLIGTSACERTHVQVATPGVPTEPEPFDVAVLGDFRSVRETAWRVANEVRIQHAAGYRTALLHVSTNGCNDLPHINPEIDALIRDRVATAVDPATPCLRTRLLVAHQPRFLLDRVGGEDPIVLPRIVADTTVIVHDASMSRDALRRTDALYKTLFGAKVVWAAVDETLRDELDAAGDPIVRTPMLWTPSVNDRGHEPPCSRRRSVPVIGRAGLCDPSQWAEDETAVLASYPSTGEVAVRVLGMPNARQIPLPAVPEQWETFGIDEMPWQRFLRGLDAFVYYPSSTPNELPKHAVAEALMAGKPVLLPPEMRPVFGKGPAYVNPREVVATVQHLWRHSAPETGWDAARRARLAWGPQVHAQRLRQLCGAPAAEPSAPSVHRATAARVLFLSSNGVGMGHLTRLLAIARRMPAPIEPVFATMSHALSIVAQAGYPVEYIPFHGTIGCDPNDWNGWLQEQLGEILDFHGARTVVFDGSNPYQGLLDAVAGRRDCQFVWVRRGMWRDIQNNSGSIKRQRFFDLVVEPTDIAESTDRGATAYNRAIAYKVPPIRLLDEEDLWTREEACARLGLDPNRPAALIQLGSGSNRDIVTMIDTVLARLAERPEIQPVLAEWLISPNRLEMWPEIKRLRGFPISGYYNAFDFTISAAGYNSFNEIVSFGLPAIFMANDHATMDDQGGRAAYAQANDAGFCLPEYRADAIGPLVEAILDPETRSIMRANCARISQGNGASDAADAIAELVA